VEIVILRSTENQYVRIVGAPDEIPMDEALKKVESIISKVKEDNPDDWTWELMQEAFEEAGLTVPEWAHGAYWDE
jgi:hypothetical protein